MQFVLRDCDAAILKRVLTASYWQTQQTFRILLTFNGDIDHDRAYCTSPNIHMKLFIFAGVCESIGVHYH